MRDKRSGILLRGTEVLVASPRHVLPLHSGAPANGTWLTLHGSMARLRHHHGRIYNTAGPSQPGSHVSPIARRHPVPRSALPETCAPGDEDEPGALRCSPEATRLTPQLHLVASPQSVDPPPFRRLALGPAPLPVALQAQALEAVWAAKITRLAPRAAQCSLAPLKLCLILLMKPCMASEKVKTSGTREWAGGWAV
ncbi:hypothetical protein EYF80_026979 [Liparis tanakae]|uniref:Uncharacterized protein n=1 Tax=Liparis tanakae TaxID=230148 RepID=A0A4Z2HCK8_9TELE|nr:hypothetical protein EYF80_026979 [Liparis tanakae]